MRTIPLRQFDFDQSTRRLSADASDLGPGAMYQVYNDSIDLGITVHSHHTGRDITFVCDHIEVDGEGDIMYWDLIPTGKQDPRTAELSVRLYND